MPEVYLVIIIVCFAAYEAIAHQIERRRSINRERELLAAVFARDAQSYVAAVDAIRKTGKQRINELKLENELAQAAVEIEERQSGIPVR